MSRVMIFKLVVAFVLIVAAFGLYQYIYDERMNGFTAIVTILAAAFWVDIDDDLPW